MVGLYPLTQAKIFSYSYQFLSRCSIIIREEDVPEFHLRKEIAILSLKRKTAHSFLIHSQPFYR